MQRLGGQQSACELSVCHRWRSAGGHGKWPDLPAWPDATYSPPAPLAKRLFISDWASAAAAHVEDAPLALHLCCQGGVGAVLLQVPWVF